MQKKSVEQQARIILNRIICENKVAPLMEQIKDFHNGTFVHSVNVGFIVAQMGFIRDLPQNRLYNLVRGAVLHDIGKLDIPVEILDKEDVLSEEEYDLIKRHPLYGYARVKDMGFDETVSKIILQHHERLDGSGYPNGLKEHQLPIETQMVCVADVFDAQSSQRSYKAERSGQICLGTLMEGCGFYFDEEAVRLIRMCPDK